jgi:hypothetical protein
MQIRNREFGPVTGYSAAADREPREIFPKSGNQVRSIEVGENFREKAPEFQS